jgi:hypothetical protein
VQAGASETGPLLVRGLSVSVRKLQGAGQLEFRSARGVELSPVSVEGIAGRDGVELNRPADVARGAFVDHHQRPLSGRCTFDRVDGHLAVEGDRLVGHPEMLAGGASGQRLIQPFSKRSQNSCDRATSCVTYAA